MRSYSPYHENVQILIDKLRSEELYENTTWRQVLLYEYDLINSKIKTLDRCKVSMIEDLDEPVQYLRLITVVDDLLYTRADIIEDFSIPSYGYGGETRLLSLLARDLVE